MIRPARLKKRRDFTKVAATRKKWVSPGFILQVRKRKTALTVLYPRTTQHLSDRLPDIRIGFTVSKKVGNAVVRNRTKRRLRALIDEIEARAFNPGYDLVLIGRRETRPLAFSSLRKDLGKALIKTGVMASDHPLEGGRK